jgi:hypothetical protein
MEHAVKTPPERLSGFKWPVAVSRVIPATKQHIWDLISSPGMLPLYHPFCEKNPASEWPGPDSRDEIHYFNGLVLERRFFGWHEDVGYDLEIGRSGGRTSVVSWRIAEIKERRTEITITVYPFAVQHLPVILRWVPHLTIIRPQLTRYLESVVRGLDWFASMGETVRRNQFGSHPWFSPELEE